MTLILAQSKQAQQAYKLVTALQSRFVNHLQDLAKSLDSQQCFEPVEWLRDDGIHGGGTRFSTADGDIIGRGSVNVSQVHYDENPEKKLGSATAISTIIHPCHPHAPSVHIHISWTEMKNGQGYWRMMADLNPAIADKDDAQTFLAALKKAAPAQYDEAIAQGDRYFYIPVLERHRGIAHFYLEQYHTDNADNDIALAQAVGEAAIDTYVHILGRALTHPKAASQADKDAQLAYHTLYFLQVLTLDRGTTTGLMVHNQNDIGILGSLPAYVNRDLLMSWVERMPKPQDTLLRELIAVLPHKNPSYIGDDVKKCLANVSREHYEEHPEALAMQASGDVIPPTLKNHQS